MSKKEKKKRREEQATNRIPRRNSASFKPEYSSKQTLLLIISNLEEALVSVPTGRFSPSLVLGSRRPNVPPSKNSSPRCLRRFLRFFIEGPSPFFARGSFFPVRSISGNAFGPRPRRPRPVKRGRYARIATRF